jgi:hypothetical protein
MAHILKNTLKEEEYEPLSVWEKEFNAALSLNLFHHKIIKIKSS